MKSVFRNILSLTIISLISVSVASGQPKSIGTVWSFSGISASYEHYTKDNGFIDLVIKAECGDLFFGMAQTPGITASFTWNMIFAEKKSVHGNDIRFFAGPGIIAGWSNDLLKPPGFIFGLKGRIGTECEFHRHVTLSAAICPVIGTHMLMPDGYPDLRVYRIGLLSIIMPEVGIKFSF